MIFLLPSAILSTQLHLPLLCFWDFAFSYSFFCIRLIPLVVDLLCVVVILVRGISRLFLTAGAVEFGFVVCPKPLYGQLSLSHADYDLR